MSLIAQWFARPAWLLLPALPAALSVAAWLIRRLRRRGREGAAGLGRLPPVGAPARPVLGALGFGAAWLALAAGLAAPLAGGGDPEGVARGRDIILVLDFSRSMLAEDTAAGARWRAAARAAEGFVESCARRPGHRVGLVLFAARPSLRVPLTTDLEYLKLALGELDARSPPAAILPGPASLSGTRIGDALALAVASHDARFAGAQDVILLSDGDDPAQERDWQPAVTLARTRRIPVHAAGFGDPERASPVPLPGGGFLSAATPAGEAAPVETRLQLGVLGELATEARGRLLAAGRGPADLAGFYRREVEPGAPTRDYGDEARPEPGDAAPACLLLAALLLGVAWRL